MHPTDSPKPGAHDPEVMAPTETVPAPRAERRKGGRPPKWTPQQRAEAISVARDHGAAEAARRTGIPKSSIHRWCRDAGIDVVATTTDVAHRARAVAKAVGDRTRADLVARLAAQLDDATHVTGASLEARRGLVDALETECQTPHELAVVLAAAGIDPGDEAITATRVADLLHKLQDREQASHAGQPVTFVAHRIPRPPRPDGFTDRRSGPLVPVSPGEELVGDNGQVVRCRDDLHLEDVDGREVDAHGHPVSGDAQ